MMYLSIETFLIWMPKNTSKTKKLEKVFIWQEIA